jgi:hypothetical protein
VTEPVFRTDADAQESAATKTKIEIENKGKLSRRIRVGIT